MPLQRAIAAIAGAFAMIFIPGCASTKPAPPAGVGACDVPIEIHSTDALLSTSQNGAEGILILRGISYRISISNWSFGSISYKATGTVCRIETPAEITGQYRVNGTGNVWRNANGVEIHVGPPLPAPPKSGELEVKLSGALLPRQVSSLS